MGLDINRYHIIPVEKRQIDGVTDNMNNLCSLRSSYNPAGFNDVCRRYDLPDMYDIFGACTYNSIDSDDYWIEIDRDLIPCALLLANKTRDGFANNQNIDKYYIETIDIIIAMLTEMHNTGYGLLLSWSA